MIRKIVLLVCCSLSFITAIAGTPQISHRFILVRTNNALDDAKWNDLVSSIHDVQGVDKNKFLGLSYVYLNPEKYSSQEILQVVSRLEASPAVDFASYYLENAQHQIAGVSDEICLKISAGNDATFKIWCAAHDVRTITAHPHLNNTFTIRINKNIGAGTIDVAEELRALPWIVYAAPNYILHPEVTAVNDPLYNRQWALQNEGTPVQGNGTPGADIDILNAWQISTGSPSIKVAILDSGIDTAHVDLKDNLLPGKDAVGDSTGGFPTPNYAMDGHGTCTAGIVAATGNNSLGIAGVAYGSKIFSVRVFYYLNLGGTIIPASSADIFSRGYTWAAYDGHADVMSSSWGLNSTYMALLPGGTPSVTEAIDSVHANGRDGKGIALFFSSGNDNVQPVLWPSNLASTISVGATNMCDTRKDTADCSGENWGCNFGTKLSFAAPGVLIASTDMTGSHGFSGTAYTYTFNGTSAACPFAAGTAALLLSINPNLTAEQIRFFMEYSCDTVGGYNYHNIHSHSLWCDELGYGRINAFRALRSVQAYNKVDENKVPPLAIYPNPADNFLEIKNVQDENASIAIYNVNGEILLSENLHTSEINTGNLASGFYLLKVTTAKGSTIAKISVQH
jgi:subtilisin family serine protease